jgi:hypothetical protein
MVVDYFIADHQIKSIYVVYLQKDLAIGGFNHCLDTVVGSKLKGLQA